MALAFAESHFYFQMADRGRIELLSSSSSALLFAYQVVPNPYIAIKELVENSLDAHSTSIEIGISHVDNQYTYVIEDDGDGIELTEDFGEYGSTSKIGGGARGEAPAEGGRSYGYRGTAIYCLKHICDVSINTRRRGEAFSREVTFVDRPAGERSCEGKAAVVRVSHRSHPGTTIKISNMYRALPIRERFVKENIVSYLRHLASVFKHYVTIHNARMSLQKNGKPLFSYNKSIADRTCRFLYVNNIRHYKASARISFDAFALHVVLMEKRDRDAENVISVGGQSVENKRIHKELHKVFEEVREHLVYHLEISSLRVDHGSRSDKRDGAIYKEALLVKQISELADHEVVRKIKMEAGGLKSKPVDYSAQFVYGYEVQLRPEAYSIPASNTGRDAVPEARPVSASPPPTQPSEGPRQADEEKAGKPVSLRREDVGRLAVIGQFNKGFILTKIEMEQQAEAEKKTLFYVVDQHAAHEIVMYHKLKSSFFLERQKLMKPIDVALSEMDEYLLGINSDIVGRNGFKLSPAMKAIVEVPMYNGEAFGVDEFYEVLEQIKSPETARRGAVLFSKFKRIIANKACRGSIMIGEELSMKQMKAVVEELAKVEKPWNCPHGRPTLTLLEY